MKPLELLTDSSPHADAELPESLARLYGGRFGVATGALYANFIVSLDGVVAVSGIQAPQVLAAGSDGDRFVMALLRARADAVLVGAGTFRANPEHHWTPDFAWPAASQDFAEYRRRLGLSLRPTLVVVTGTGGIDTDHAALGDGACIMTPADVAPSLRARVPKSVNVRPVGPPFSLAQVVAALRADGARTILCEGGPTILGELLAARLVDELFLTVSPVLAGRDAGTRALVEGVEFLRAAPVRATLASLRTDRTRLFTRHVLER